jgi:mevalonate kinase
VERLHHGTPSGIDNTVIAHGVPVCFKREQPGELLRVARPFCLLIGDTGVRAPTRDSVAAVRALWESDPPGCEAVFDRIGQISLSARRAIEQGELDALGPLMDENHSLLQQLTVSSPELDCLVAAARQAGARGAKLSGGGRGGNMIALAGEAGGQEIRARLLAAGAAGCLETRIASPG